MISAQGSKHVMAQTGFLNKGSGGVGPLWYAGCQNQTPFTTIGGYTLNIIYTTPFSISRAVILTKISFEVAVGGAAGSRTRVGIYRATSLSNMYPSSLVVDGGDYDATVTGVKTTGGLSILMAPGQYWAAMNSGVASPTLRSVSVNNAGFFGRDNTFAFALGLSGVSAYGALPAVFPVGGSINNTFNLIAMEFA